MSPRLAASSASLTRPSTNGKADQTVGEAALINRKPGCRPGTSPLRTPPAIEEKILHLRRRYHFGPQRIAWYLERYHGITITGGGVYSVLCRYGMDRLPRNQRSRSIPTYRRYERQVPRHHVQVDVKFLLFHDPFGRKIKLYQFTAIDDATRVRALKIYPRHTQASAIEVVDYVRDRFPFRIHTIRTDRGHEVQARFHWHVEDLVIRHVNIKPRTPRLNGKVERSYGTDERKFYQLLEYTDDVNLNRKMAEWERFYTFQWPHGAHGGKTPYAILRERLQ